MDAQIRIDSDVQYGVRPGKGFYEALLAPLETKEYVTNESRLEDGVRVLSTPVKFKKRSLTLEFLIVADTHEHLEQYKSWFFSYLYRGGITLNVTGINKTFHLIYTGKSPSYTGGGLGCACRIKVGFDEPNPNGS